MKKIRHLQVLFLVFLAALFIMAPRSVFAYAKNSVSGKIVGNYLASELKDDAKLEMTGTVSITIDCKKTIKQISCSKKGYQLTLKNLDNKLNAGKLTIQYRGSGGTMNTLPLGSNQVHMSYANVYLDAKSSALQCGKLKIENSTLYAYAKNGTAIDCTTLETTYSDLTASTYDGKPITAEDGIKFNSGYVRAEMRHFIAGNNYSRLRTAIYCSDGSITVGKKARVYLTGTQYGMRSGKKGIYIYGLVSADTKTNAVLYAPNSSYGSVVLYDKADVELKSEKGRGIYAGVTAALYGGAKLVINAKEYGIIAGKAVQINDSTVKTTNNSNAGISTDGDVFISNSNVTAEGAYAGIRSQGAVEIKGGNTVVSLKGGSDVGLYGKKGINIIRAKSVDVVANRAVITGKNAPLKLGSGMAITYPVGGRIYKNSAGCNTVARKDVNDSTNYVTIAYTKLDGTVKISGGKYATQTCTATYTGYGSNLRYKWEVSSDGKTWTTRQSGSNSTYKSVAADSVKWLRVTVTSPDFSGSVASDGKYYLSNAYVTINKISGSKTATVGETVNFYVTALNAGEYDWIIYRKNVATYSWDIVKQHASVTGLNTSAITIRPKDTFLDGTLIYCRLRHSTTGLYNTTDSMSFTVKPAPTVTPTPTTTPTVTPTPTSVPTVTPTPTTEPPVTVTPIPTVTPTPIPEVSPTPTPAPNGTTLKDSKGNTYTSITTDPSNPKVAYKKPRADLSGNAAIPATVTIDGIKYRVTWLAANAFKNNKEIMKITIGKYVTTIGKSAFSGCSNLKTVNIGNNVTTIRDLAFYKCSSLTSVTFPAKVKTIGKNSFAVCKKLATMKFKTKLLTEETVGADAFRLTPKKMKVSVPKDKLSDYKALLLARGVAATATFVGF